MKNLVWALVIMVLVGGFVASRFLMPVGKAAMLSVPILDTVVPPLSTGPNKDCHHALVCGGIHTFQDFALAQRDSALLSFYSDFDILNAQFTTLDKDTWAYVSYMKDGRIYFTHKKILIRAGEPILWDGKTAILTHCGNMFSLERMGETSGEEPSDIYPSPITDSLPSPESIPVVIETGALLPAPITPAVSSDSEDTPPSFTDSPLGCCYVGGPPIFISETPIVSTPEPTTILLSSWGVLLVLIVGGLWKRP